MRALIFFVVVASSVAVRAEEADSSLPTESLRLADIPGIPLQTFTTHYLRAEEKPPPTSVPKVVYLWVIKAYRSFVSPGRLKSCPMHPSCSAYFLQATEKHGGCLGCMMSADRFMRDNAAPDRGEYYPHVRTETRGVKHNDPVEDNDFWFSDE